MTKAKNMVGFKKLVRLLVLVATLLCVFVQLAFAEPKDNSTQTVKVGYYHELNFQEGKDAESLKKGYAYEYYQLLARESGWKYEYVYGEYDKLYDKLVKGEIDFLAGIGMVEARKELIGYPELPMGYEYYDLLKRMGDERFDA